MNNSRALRKDSTLSFDPSNCLGGSILSWGRLVLVAMLRGGSGGFWRGGGGGVW